MPNIEDFSAGNIDIRPTEIGVESTAAAGRRMGVYGSQIAQSYEQAGRALGQVATVAEQYVEHREINTAAKHAADFVVNHNQSWNDYISGKDIPEGTLGRDDAIAARINNPNAGKQWREQNLEPDLQQFQTGFLTKGGREWGDHFANTYREHMAVKTAADQSSMAGAVIQANIEKTSNALAVATFNDPSSLKANLDLFTHSVNGSVQSSPTLSPEEGTKVSTALAQRNGERLVQAAIQGTILKGGNWQVIANNPAYAPYVKPAENLQFAKMEETRQKQNAVLDRQATLLQKQIAETNATNALNQSWHDNVHFDPATGHATIDPKLIQDAIELPFKTNAPNATALARAQIDWAESRQHGVEAPVNDPATQKSLNELLYRPGATETDTKIAILQAATNHKLTPDAIKDYLELNTALHQGAIKDPLYEATMKSAEEILGTDIEGKKRFADFAFQFMQQYINARKEGKLTGDSLTITNPDGTYDENSLIYKTLKPYMRPAEEIMMNKIMQGYGALLQGTQPARPAAAAAPGASAPATPGGIPPKPAGYPEDAKWDATRSVWFVVVNGVRHQLIPTQPAQTAQP